MSKIRYIETQRLLLRPWRISDAEDLFIFASSPEVGPAAGWPPHTSIENSRNIIQNILSAPNTFAVVLKDIDRAVGSLGLMVGAQSHLKLPETECELGYWLGVPFWGRGIIPEAVRQILEYAFLSLQQEKVWCGYYEGNAKSWRVQEKCGFTYQYTKNNVRCPMLNDVRTEHVTSLTKAQWEKASPNWNTSTNS